MDSMIFEGRVLTEQAWGRKAIHMMPSPSLPLPSEADVFEAVCRAAAAKKRKAYHGVRYYEDNVLHRETDLSYLPNEADASFGGYWDRVRAERCGSEGCLIVNQMERFSRPLFRSARSLIDDLTDFDKPLPSVEVGVFIGDYTSTPLGVHTDEAHIVTLCIVGTKEFLVWEPQYFSDRGIPWHGKRLVQKDFTPFVADARRLTARPGEMLYWPTGFPHVGVPSDGEFCVSISLGIDLTAKETLKALSTPLMNAIAAKYLAAAARIGASHPEMDVASAIPDYLRAVDEAREALPSLLSDTVRRRSSSFGFEDPLWDVPATDATEGLWKASPRGRLHIVGEAPNITVYANGGVRRITATPEVFALLSHLASAKDDTVLDAGEMTSEAEKNLFGWLAHRDVLMRIA